MAEASPMSETQPATAERRKTRRSKSGVVIPHQASWRRRLAARAIYLLLRLIVGTVRCRLEDASGVFSRPRTGAVIFCFWHNRLAMCMKINSRYATNRTDGNKIAALVSASRDGGLLSRVLELFGVQPVRGSSSRRGPQALLELTTWAERGCDLAITPDGPRGPQYMVQDGVMSLAQLTGLSIVPVAFNVSWRVNVKSWDKFQIPLPFARCTVRTAAPISVPREVTDEQRETLRRRLEQTLKAISVD
jgi:lysophospholipid acyltransferase (LPLAT)-like uncharacterized protein